MPRVPHLDQGRWEEVLGLMRGVSEKSITALQLMHYGSNGVQLEIEHLELQSGTVVGLESWRAKPLRARDVAKAMGIKTAEVYRLISEAYSVVGENLATRRANNQGG